MFPFSQHAEGSLPVGEGGGRGLIAYEKDIITNGNDSCGHDDNIM